MKTEAHPAQTFLQITSAILGDPNSASRTLPRAFKCEVGPIWLHFAVLICKAAQGPVFVCVCLSLSVAVSLCVCVCYPFCYGATLFIPSDPFSDKGF